MGSKRVTGARYKVWAVTTALLLMLASLGQAQGTADRPAGRGFVWGGGLSAGRLSFLGGGDVALAAGDVTGAFSIAGETVATREGQLTDASGADTVGVAHLVAFPAAETSAGFSFHLGYAFSRRVALLLEAELVGGVESGFSTAMGGVVVRYWPTSRLWLEAGPASGDLHSQLSGSICEIHLCQHAVHMSVTQWCTVPQHTA
jgi:hypothetical protein